MALIMLFSVGSDPGSGGDGGDRQPRRHPRLVRQQPTLCEKAVATGVTAEMCGSDDAVAGNDQRNRVTAIGLTHRPWAAAGGVGYVQVAARLTVRNCAERSPDALLILAAMWVKRQVENGKFGIEICMQLV